MEAAIRILDRASIRWRFTSRGRLLALDTYTTSIQGKSAWVDVTSWSLQRLRKWATSF